MDRVDRTDRYRRACNALHYARQHLDDAVSPRTPSTVRGEWINAAEEMARDALAEIRAMREAVPRDYGEPDVYEERGPDGAWTTYADYTGGTER